MRRIAAAAALGLALLGLGGCQNEPERSVTIGTDIWTGYEPGYLAERRKLYGDADVSLRQYPSATQVLRAFRNNSIDIAATTLDEAMMLRQSGIPVRIILVTDTSDGADAIMAKPGIASVSDLAGKRMGVENSALGDYLLGRALQINGLKSSDIHEVQMTVDETETLFNSGKVDAVVTFDPFRSRLIQTGAREIFSSHEIPGEIVDVLVVHEDFAKANPNVLKAVTTGWLAGADIVNRHLPDVITELARRLGLSNEKVEDSLSGLHIPDAADNHALLNNETGELARAANKLIPVLEVRNGTRFQFAPATLFSDAYLPDDRTL